MVQNMYLNYTCGGGKRTRGWKCCCVTKVTSVTSGHKKRKKTKTMTKVIGLWDLQGLGYMIKISLTHWICQRSYWNFPRPGKARKGERSLVSTMKHCRGRKRSKIGKSGRRPEKSKNRLLADFRRRCWRNKLLPLIPHQKDFVGRTGAFWGL